MQDHDEADMDNENRFEATWRTSKTLSHDTHTHTHTPTRANLQRNRVNSSETKEPALPLFWGQTRFSTMNHKKQNLATQEVSPHSILCTSEQYTPALLVVQ